ncbi:MAG: CoA protein activase [Chloroflexi bacterium]|nr:CoA protein activase [Chloroflexota bacterium]MBU1747127.1 CoA protein activase [Chloroflexota bacterium]MBU1878367.1 CoA protein activase [Chloroflexota bacterium]
MIVTYPHIGEAYVALEVLFRTMGLDVVSPPLSSQRTLTLGSQLSPEFICVPFKVILGNMIEALEQGADTVFTLEKQSGCRLGYYPKIQMAALREQGYEFTMHPLQLMDGSAVTAIKELRRTTGVPLRRILHGIAMGLPIMKTLDDLDCAAYRIRPRELTPGSASKVLRQTKQRLRQVSDWDTFRRIRREAFEALDDIPIDRQCRPLKVIILGEFYMVLDAFMNMRLEEELGRRGVEVERSIYIGKWLDFNMFLRALHIPETHSVERVARPYLRRNVAGDGLKSIGETILHAQAGYDGVIHVQPFTCAPEIVAANIMPDVVRDHNIPVLPLVFDEQTGRTGVVTRLEAFVDLLERRRSIREGRYGQRAGSK